jgi:hypothetical protein
MNWADTVKTTALAVLAERTATAARIAVDVPWSWNPHDVWLTRINRPRELPVQASIVDPSAPSRHGTERRD